MMEQQKVQRPWHQLGQELMVGSILDADENNDDGLINDTIDDASPPPPTIQVAVDDNGRRLVVGASRVAGGRGSVLVYDLVDVVKTTATNDEGKNDADDGANVDDNSSALWRLRDRLDGHEGEGLGNYLSLSPDGRFLAVRRHAPFSAVQVYEIIEESSDDEPSLSSPSLRPVGASLGCIDPGLSVSLGQSIGGTTWILVGCESWLSDRGQVQAYRLDETTTSNGRTISASWTPLVPSLKGRNVGDRFGAATVVIGIDSASFRVAVASPHFNNGQGMVQVFTYDSTNNGGWQQFGDDLTGLLAGEHFGASVAMSRTLRPFLAVGAPEWSNRGIACVYNWQSSALGALPEWTLLKDSMLAGTDHGDRFGSSVAISQGGDIVVVASNRNDGNNKDVVDYVAVFERETFNKIGGIVNGLIYGQSMGLNGNGVLIASASSDGCVRAFLNDAPYCSVPRADTDPELALDLSFDRTICRSNGALVKDSEDCSNQSVFLPGGFQSCRWQNSLFTQAPSQSPSLSPSLRPLESPSMKPYYPPESPVPTPVLQTLHPSGLPSQLVSNHPSFIPTKSAVLTFTPSRPTFQTKMPSGSAVSLEPSVAPSHYVDPSSSPSLGFAQLDDNRSGSPSLRPSRAGASGAVPPDSDGNGRANQQLLWIVLGGCFLVGSLGWLFCRRRNRTKRTISTVENFFV